MKAKVAYTYGWTDGEIMALDTETFFQYWMAITPIEAQKALVDSRIATFPNMKKEDQRKFDSEFRKKAYSTIKKSDSDKPKDMKEIAKRLALKMRGNG